MERKDVKDVLILLGFVLPLFAGVVFAFQYSPMYAEAKDIARQHAIEYIESSLMWGIVTDNETIQKVLAEYDLNLSDYGPAHIFERDFESETHNENLGESK